MRTPSVLEENDSRDQLWAVSEIFLRAGRNRSSVRHNSFLWSLAPLRFVLNVKGKIPYTDGRPLERPASASVVGDVSPHLVRVGRAGERKE
eukprot:COSAG02_NODE_265_length_26599_cov_13.943698_7_plen_91_part_00